jgi:hypothetical protein
MDEIKTRVTIADRSEKTTKHFVQLLYYNVILASLKVFTGWMK